jgi:hypothetical protein
MKILAVVALAVGVLSSPASAQMGSFMDGFYGGLAATRGGYQYRPRHHPEWGGDEPVVQPTPTYNPTPRMQNCTTYMTGKDMFTTSCY